ncbi:MAG: FG-GAP repeat protein [Deltaproteobacteria bacterium]|nr:FG-GAP repeat protein [Deltaproteobacteria bacterium]
MRNPGLALFACAGLLLAGWTGDRGGSTKGTVFALDDPASYDMRFDGACFLRGLSSSMAVGDVNADGWPDLALCAAEVEYAGVHQPATFVLFGGPGFGLGVRSLADAASYDVMLPGSGDKVAIGDVDGDGWGDLLLAPDSGSVWVVSSAQLAGLSGGGHVLPLDDPASFRVRYDGAGAMAFGDFDRDGSDDLLLRSESSLYAISSSLIAALGPGHTQGLDDPTAYIIRFDIDGGRLGETEGQAAGDVDGDGECDLVIVSSTGRAWMISSSLLAGASGTGNMWPLSDPGSYTIRFETDGFSTGRPVLIEDLNRDGETDLVLSSTLADFGGENAGCAWVISSTRLASASGSGNAWPLTDSASYDLRIDGPAGARLTTGHMLAAGDVDGDGHADLLLGSHLTSSAWLIDSSLIAGASSGSALSLADPASYSMLCQAFAGQYFTACEIGDVDGDAVGDVVLGAEDVSSGWRGNVWVLRSALLGTLTGTGNELDLLDSGAYSAYYRGGMFYEFGEVLGIGDLDGDACGDLVLGAASSDANGLDAGSAWVVLSTSIEDMQGDAFEIRDPSGWDARLDGDFPVSYLSHGGGIAVGDLNEDGCQDLVVAACNSAYNGQESGSLFVVFGDPDPGAGERSLADAASFHVRIDGAAAGDRLGCDGLIEVSTLSAGGLLAIADVNGDGHGDLVVGSAESDHNGDDSGSVWVIFSRIFAAQAGTGNVLSLADPASYNVRFDGETGDNLGYAGAMSTGDVNGDSAGDLVIGSLRGGYGGVWVILSTLLDGVFGTGEVWPLGDIASYKVRYGDGGLLYGRSCIGDVNGDGLGDLVLAAPRAEYGGQNSGSAYVILSALVAAETGTGNNRTLDYGGNYSVRFDGEAESDRLAMYGAMEIGDVNGDGFGDLVLAAPDATPAGRRSGRVYVIFSTSISGASGAMPLADPASYNLRLEGDAAGRALGLQGLMATGDVDGDGAGDLVLGGMGRTWVLLSTRIDDVGAGPGSTWSLADPASYNIRYDGTGEENTALAIDDLDGDGLGDLVLSNSQAQNNGYASGSIWVVSSALIDDLGGTTGHVMPLSDAASYSARYDGSSRDALGEHGALATGDLNGDGTADLFMGARSAGAAGDDTGSVWVVIGGQSCSQDAECDDGVACTADDCIESAGRCRHEPDDALCSNGLFCDGRERCAPGHGCQAGVDPCDDRVGCTQDSCDEGMQSCAHVPDDALCSNGLFCDGEETCDAQRGCLAGDDPCPGQICDEGSDVCRGCMSDADCNDGVDCTIDECDEGDGTCSSTPDDDLCDDGLFCNGPEACDALQGCLAGEPPCPDQVCDEQTDSCSGCVDDADCDDGLGCTIDVCDHGICTNSPDSDSCDDDLFCTGEETCEIGTGCVSSGDPCAAEGLVCDEEADACVACQGDADCDDGVGCTVDVCDQGRCTSTPDDGACPDDGLFCNGAEGCDFASGCVSSGNPCQAEGLLCDEEANACAECLSDADCSDGVDCTADRCQDGSCDSVPEDPLCDNGSFCDGQERCDPTRGCQAGSDPCDDGDECTIDSCDEQADRCDHDADPACDEGSVSGGCGCAALPSGASPWVLAGLLFVYAWLRRRRSACS